MSALLEVKNLHVHYVTDEERVRAVNGVSFSLEKGKVLGLVGETGAGKTTTALSIMQLVPNPPGLIVDGEILFNGKNVIYHSPKENQQMRGAGISMIFQDPMTALNPIMTIRAQLLEILKTHRSTDSKEEAERRVLELLRRVGVSEERLGEYPHQFSGGMKQRVVIAMALLCEPELLIADEPTTALDVTIQAQVLDIMKDLQKTLGMSMILISHDLGVVAETCDQVAILYAGQIVEEGSVRQVYRKPRHPYTRGLFDSLPNLDRDEEELKPIPGNMPNAAMLPSGCPLHPRCRYAQPICSCQEPPRREVRHEGEQAELPHYFRCHFDPLSEDDAERKSQA